MVSSTSPNPALDSFDVMGMLPPTTRGDVYGCSVMDSMLAVAEEFLKGRDVSRGYAANVRRTARKLAAAGITPATIDGERVSSWLSSMTCGSVTVASERRTALTLWKWAIDEGIITKPIRRVKKLVVRRKLVRAFDRVQCTRAVKFFSDESFVRENHTFQKSKCPVALWMEAWTRLCYETALRFGDAYNLREEALVHGGIAVIASKTNQPVVRRVSARTSELLEKLASMSPDGTVFSWAVSRRWAFANIRRYFKLAGLDAGRSQWLRRSAATHAEMLEQGAGAKVLGHKTPGLAEKFYLDQSQLLSKMPSAPLLD